MVIVAGVLLGGMWVMQQYYVAASSDRVVIYQGVHGSALGIPLQRVEQQTDIALADLPEDYRNRVQDGIVSSDGLAGAQGTVQKLRENRLPVCAPLPPATTPPPVPNGEPGAGQPGTTGAPTTAAQPPGQVTAPDAQVPDTTLQTETPVPGLTCRPGN